MNQARTASVCAPAAYLFLSLFTLLLVPSISWGAGPSGDDTVRAALADSENTVPEQRESPQKVTLPKIAPPSRAKGATVARIIAPTFARYRLGGRRGRLIKPETHWSGKPQRLLVLTSATRLGRSWLKVLLPFRPNGNTAWIPRDYVHLTRTPFWVEVGLRRRQLMIFRNGRKVRTMRVVIGAPKTPTPLGLSAVHEINRQPDPRAFLGPWVLSLTSHSDVLMRFEGGPGRIGIHGRSGESLRDPLGSARSNGCIRVTNRQITWMAKHLSEGTPVRVRR